MLDAEALHRENRELRAQLSLMVAELGESRSTISELAGQVAKLNDRIAELLAAVKRKPRKAPAEKAPEPAPDVEPTARRAFEDRPKAPEIPPKSKPPKQPPTPVGRMPIPDHLEAEEHDLRPDHCDHCGSTRLHVVDTIEEEKLHVVKEHQRRRVVRRTTCRCPDCGTRTTPRSLPAPYARSKVTCEWLAWFVHAKFVMLTPLDRIRRDLADRDIPIAKSTLVSFIARAATLLAPIDGLHWRQLLAGSWMATDGTGLKVLVEGLPAAHNGYVELYRVTRPRSCVRAKPSRVACVMA